VAQNGWQTRLAGRWATRQADRPGGHLPLRHGIGFAVSLAFLAVLLGVVLPAVGWVWTVVLLLAYCVNGWCLALRSAPS
jgi:hypothetical protein